MPVPTVAACLPELWRFLCNLRQALLTDELSEGDFDERCEAFYSAAEMATIESVVPRWVAMASFQDGKTLRHTTAALVSLMDLAEYRGATPGEQHLMEWTVVLHDIAKEAPPGGREYVHGFKSAAHAGRVLPTLGFGVSAAWESGFESWFAMTDSAFCIDGDREIQDNDRLPAILGGADRLFAPDAARAVKAIALHISLTVLAEWPQASPLSMEEARELIDEDLRPLLLTLMLADSGGWNLFDPESLAAMYAETRAVFEMVAAVD